ncbi:MAG: twin-arginine translocation signal domain-containing protein [Geodermatophilaceae bacterium]
MGMSRRTLLQAAAVGGALAALPMSSASAVVGVKPEVPYTGTNCFFKSNVTAAPIDSTLTAQQISWSNANQFRGYPILRGFSSTSWGTPLAEGRSTDPTWTLLGGRNVSPGFDGKFRAPQNLADYITGNTDSPLVVRDNVNRQSVVTAKVSPGSTDPVNHTITHNGGFIG